MSIIIIVTRNSGAIFVSIFFAHIREMHASSWLHHSYTPEGTRMNIQKTWRSKETSAAYSKRGIKSMESVKLPL